MTTYIVRGGPRRGVGLYYRGGQLPFAGFFSEWSACQRNAHKYQDPDHARLIAGVVRGRVVRLRKREVAP